VTGGGLQAVALVQDRFVGLFRGSLLGRNVQGPVIILVHGCRRRAGKWRASDRTVECVVGIGVGISELSALVERILPALVEVEVE
jgi:hypothetical protein